MTDNGWAHARSQDLDIFKGLGNQSRLRMSGEDCVKKKKNITVRDRSNNKGKQPMCEGERGTKNETEQARGWAEIS